MPIDTKLWYAMTYTRTISSVQTFQVPPIRHRSINEIAK